MTLRDRKVVTGMIRTGSNLFHHHRHHHHHKKNMRKLTGGTETGIGIGMWTEERTERGT
jgi:hypothetical protein